MTIDEWIKNGKPWNVILHGDCMDLMKHFNDKEVSLSIVDPPYGGNDAIDLKDNINKSSQATQRTVYKQFDNIEPSEEYWKELFRISKNQIVWGCNFYTKINLHGGRLVWDKKGTAFGRAEEAYLSMTKSVNIFEYTWNGMLQENMKQKDIRIHPTQKPVALYRWLLQNYAKPGDKIIDTHSGSGSCAIACHLEKFDFLAIEKDEDYYKASVKRLEEIRSQGVLF
jgi:site-specific DNA-methyltransferase (adenine-specific)